MATETQEHDGRMVGHEERDVRFRPVVLAGIGLIVVITGAFVGLRGLLDYYVVRAERTSPALNPLAREYDDRVPPAPRLQTHPRRDLHQLHASEDTILNNYGWIDREKQVVHIPIDRAMQLLAERGTAAAK